jgi:hypothetical protein
MGVFKFNKQDRSTVATPLVGFISMFVDIDTDKVTLKDDQGVFHELVNDSGSVPTVIVPGTRFVSSLIGNDGTALPDRMDLPYATITAAQVGMNFGDTIHVMKGNYNESDLGIHGANYYFDPGTTLNSNIAFNDMGNGNMSINVYGHCYFQCSTLIKVQDSSTSVFEAKLISASGKLFDIGNSAVNSLITIKSETDIICTNQSNNGEVKATSHVYLTAAKKITCDGGFVNAQAGVNNKMVITAPLIENNSTTAAPTVLYVIGGETIVNGNIKVVNPFTNQGSIFTDGGGDGTVTINGNIEQSGSILIRNRSGRIVINGKIKVTSSGLVSTNEGGTTEFRDTVSGDPATSLIFHSSGKTLVYGLVINTLSDPSAMCVRVNGAGFISKQTASYYTTGGGSPLDAGSPQTVKTYPGVVYNNPINVNITEVISTGLVNPNIDTE